MIEEIKYPGSRVLGIRKKKKVSAENLVPSTQNLENIGLQSF